MIAISVSLLQLFVVLVDNVKGNSQSLDVDNWVAVLRQHVRMHHVSKRDL
jgi:membrane-anchored glycerophosphoryl diester phosphodiesterase (GDPDase)